MPEKYTLRYLKNQTVYRRADGTTWQKMTQYVHARVEQRGFTKNWTPVSGGPRVIDDSDMDEIVEIIAKPY
jgi:hypothetical protein